MALQLQKVKAVMGIVGKSNDQFGSAAVIGAAAPPVLCKHSEGPYYKWTLVTAIARVAL